MRCGSAKYLRDAIVHIYIFALRKFVRISRSVIISQKNVFVKSLSSFFEAFAFFVLR